VCTWVCCATALIRHIGGEPKDQFALDAMKAFRKCLPHLFASPPKCVTVHDLNEGPEFWDSFDRL
jgi:hypothetical protein